MTPSTPTSTRYSLIDVFRGLICLWVVVDHAGFALHTAEVDVPGWEGWARNGLVGALRLALGPSLFFAISGYCIAASVDSTRRKGHSAGIFMARRVWRTFPPYWAALLGFVVLVASCEAIGLGRLVRGGYTLALDSPADITLAQWIGNLTLTETWRPILGGGAGVVYTRVAWSLCYQEQFYFVCFLTLLVCRGRFHTALMWVTGLTLFFRLFCWDSGRLHRIDGLFPIFWHEFAAGLMAYWRLQVASTVRQKRLLEAGMGSLVLIGLYEQMPTTAAAGALGLALVGLRRHDHHFAGFRWLEPLRACGRRSYSIYLAHLPVSVIGVAALVEGLDLTHFWVRALVVVPLISAVGVAVGWAFHATIERRFLDLPSERSPATRPTPALVQAGAAA